MHARHRSPGNGYRSNSMGSGMARISPDGGSVRGHGYYNSSEHRSFNNRSFNRGHGHPKAFRPPPPPPPQPRKGDIFMEAGRLATEYLVSRGVLPSSVLKWQNNGSLKKEFQEFRAQEGDNMHEGSRASALSRLGTGNDVVSGRRRYVEEFGPSGLRNYPKGKRRVGGSFKGYNSDWVREYQRNGSWSDRRGNSDMDNDSESSHHDDQITKRVNKDNSQLGRKEENASVERPSGEVGEIGEIAESETQNSVSAGNLKERVEEEGSASIKMGKQIALEDLPTEPSEKIDDLGSLCRFPNMTKRTRSPLTSRRRKAFAVGTNFDAGTSKGSKVVIEDETFSGSSVDNNNNNIPCLDSDTSKVVSLEEAKPSSVLAPVLGVEQEEPQESKLTPEKDCQDQEPSQELPGGTERRGEKRAAEESDGEEANKKQREWLSSSCKEEAELEKVPEIKQEPVMEFAQEKQLFPNSFKICDLNLVEGSDANEGQERGQTDYPSMPKKEVSPVDVDLAISNSTTTPIHVGRNGADGRVIEIIDLETDESTPEDKPFEPERKVETAFTSLDGFSNPLMSTSVIPDNQDNYGLMFSDFMANDFTSCSSVPGEMNPLDNMALHNAEGPLEVDDSIYMSFGEIPFLGFMPTWEQPPPQPDRKPF